MQALLSTHTRRRLQRGSDGRQSVGLAAGGGDAGGGEPVVRRQGLEPMLTLRVSVKTAGFAHLEKADDSVEERDGLRTLGATTREAGRTQRAVARAVGAPLVLRHGVKGCLGRDDECVLTSQNCSFSPLISTQYLIDH